MSLNKFTVISDIGVDDALALVLLDRLRSSENKSLYTTFGNCPVEQVNDNSQALLPGLGKNWKLYEGPEVMLNGLRSPFTAYEFHGADGLWGVRPPIKNKAPFLNGAHRIGKVISLGPLTQLCRLKDNDSIDSVVMMGGDFSGLNSREPNIAMDIEAASLFFKACDKINVSIVPKNISKLVGWSLDDIKKIPEEDEINIWLKELMLMWFKRCNYGFFSLHDPLTVFLGLNPQYASWISSGVRVSDDGNTYIDSRNPPCKIANDIKDPEIIARKIFTSIFTS